MNYRHEFVSGVFVLDREKFGTESSIDVWVVNRGETVEYFRVVMTNRSNPPDVESNDYAVDPGGLKGFGLGVELGEPDVVDYELRWVRIFTTSMNLVPSIRYSVYGATDPPVTPVYFAPGDFAVFDIVDRGLPVAPSGGTVKDE